SPLWRPGAKAAFPAQFPRIRQAQAGPAADWSRRTKQRGRRKAELSIGRPLLRLQATRIDRRNFDDSMYIVSRLIEGNELDPVQQADFSLARITKILEPGIDPAGSCVIGGQGQGKHSTIAGQHGVKVGAAETKIVRR